MREADRQRQAELDQIANCAVCHLPESAHHGDAGASPDILAAFGALGACIHYTVSPQAIDKVRRQQSAPRHAPRCTRCGGAGHIKRTCPW